MNQPYIHTYLLLFGLPSHPVHYVEFPVLYSMFSLVIYFRQSIKERRSWWRKETNPEHTVHPWRVSITFPVGGYLPFAVLYSILNILFHIHLWTTAWLFLTWLAILCRPLYSYPCFSWAIRSLWVITTGPVTILLNGWGFMFLTWGWTQKWITSPYWPSGWIISAFLWWYACFQWLETQPPSKARGWYLCGLRSVAGSGARATPT